MSSLPNASFLFFGGASSGDLAASPLLTFAQRMRCRRIGWLMLAMVMMGVADLLCTLTYMRTSGMLEANPLARFILTTGAGGAAGSGGEQLILFKVLTIVLSCGTLYLARHHRQAELSAWACTAMMLALTLHWINYNRSVSDFTNDMAVLAMSGGEFEPMWIKLDE